MTEQRGLLPGTCPGERQVDIGPYEERLCRWFGTRAYDSRRCSQGTLQNVLAGGGGLEHLVELPHLPCFPFLISVQHLLLYFGLGEGGKVSL